MAGHMPRVVGQLKEKNYSDNLGIIAKTGKSLIASVSPLLALNYYDQF
jgi:hypothetical protein